MPVWEGIPRGAFSIFPPRRGVSCRRCVSGSGRYVSTGIVRDIVGPKPTYGRDGGASPRKLGFSKIVSLLVSLDEPNCMETRCRLGRQGQDVCRCSDGLVQTQYEKGTRHEAVCPFFVVFIYLKPPLKHRYPLPNAAMLL